MREFMKAFMGYEILRGQNMNQLPSSSVSTRKTKTPQTGSEAFS